MARLLLQRGDVRWCPMRGGERDRAASCGGVFAGEFWARGAIALLLAGLLSACASPVGVTSWSVHDAYRQTYANALSEGKPSVFSTQVLLRLGLYEQFNEDQAAALEKLHAGLAPKADDDRLFALAELSFLHADALVANAGSAAPVTQSDPTLASQSAQAYYLATVVYAYAFLVEEAPAIPLDPRNRMAADLYNTALARGLTMKSDAASEPGEVALASGRYPLPFGHLDIEVDQESMIWAGRRLENFVPTVTWNVYGLRNRYRTPGIGAPLAASLAPLDPSVEPPTSRVAESLRVPVTALLRLDGSRQELRGGMLRGRLTLHTKDASPTVRLGGYDVPLEYEPTAALARTVNDIPVISLELEGFLGRQLQLFKSARGERHLVTMTPYQPGKMPVVLVHGTASSPVRWAELFNEMDADERITSRYQFWLFTYNTGNPIGFSGGLLRESLTNALNELDPEGKDPALRRMVVIGHSQGGLLAKLTVIDSGDRFWKNVSDTPFDQLDIKPENREVLRRSLFFTPLPFVDRVIFIATPHRGSHLVGARIAGLVRRIVSIPKNIVAIAADPGMARLVREGVPSAVDNMNPSNQFIKTLSSLRVDPRVKAHSIIAVQGSGPLEKLNDGVVPYTSAHIEEAVSEKVVQSPHSVQGNPEAIEEVRRILLEHAGIQ